MVGIFTQFWYNRTIRKFRGDKQCQFKIALLGFGTVASGVPFLLKENREKIVQAAQSEIEVAKVLVKDDQEKARLLEAGNDFNFVTNIDEILSDKDITIVVELMGRIEPAKHLSLVLRSRNTS